MKSDFESILLSEISNLELQMNEEQKEINILKRQITDHETTFIGLKLNRDRAREKLLKLRREKEV